MCLFVSTYCPLSPIWPNLYENVLPQQWKCFDNNKLHKILFSVGSKQLKCHRLILSVQCPYFAAMFRSDCSEAKKGEVHIEVVYKKKLHSDLGLNTFQKYCSGRTSLSVNDLPGLVLITTMFYIGHLFGHMEK